MIYIIKCFFLINEYSRPPVWKKISFVPLPECSDFYLPMSRLGKLLHIRDAPSNRSQILSARFTKFHFLSIKPARFSLIYLYLNPISGKELHNLHFLQLVKRYLYKSHVLLVLWLHVLPILWLFNQSSVSVWQWLKMDAGHRAPPWLKRSN